MTYQSKSVYIEEFNQYIFDQIVFLVLTTVSSEDYLNHYNIFRPPLKKNWGQFKNKVKKQTITPGIYPKAIFRDTVHYYGVREEIDGTLTVSNGYKSNSGIPKKYGHGLDVQEDGSHGLCQVYALMYYHNEDTLLTSGSNYYHQNVITGIRWLYKFVYTNDWNFEQHDIESIINEDVDILQNSKERYECFLSFLIHPNKKISLSTLIEIILSTTNSKYLNNWFLG
jgi:hypothetical protein